MDKKKMAAVREATTLMVYAKQCSKDRSSAEKSDILVGTSFSTLQERTASQDVQPPRFQAEHTLA